MAQKNIISLLTFGNNLLSSTEGFAIQLTLADIARPVAQFKTLKQVKIKLFSNYR